MRTVGMQKKERDSNLEMLRIIAMMMIIILHYFAYCNAGELLTNYRENDLFYKITESFTICAVDIFVLISAYFMFGKNTIRIRKLSNLVIDVAFWGALGYLISCALSWKEFDVKYLVLEMFPVIKGGRWFVTAYVIYCVLAPFFGKTMMQMGRNSYFLLLIIMTFLFCIWPSFFPYPPIDDYGYSFVNFLYLYVLMGYYKRFVKHPPAMIMCVFAGVLSGICISVSCFIGNGYAWAYNYFFVITEAISLFFIFIQIKGQSVLINMLAAGSFGVFLIHTDGFFSVVVYDWVFKATSVMYCALPLFMLSVFVCAPVFYLLGFILNRIKEILFRNTIDRLMDKIPIINKTLFIE